MDTRYNDDNDLYWIIVRTVLDACRYSKAKNELEWELDEEFDED